MTTYFNPPDGVLPGSVSLSMLVGLLRGLPLPGAGEVPEIGRALILDALAVVDAAGPRDALEATLLMQVPPLLLAARQTQALAVGEADWDRRARMQRHVMALQRRAEGLWREVRRHRRELAALGVEHVASPSREVDVARLEASWRDPAVGLEAAVLTPRAVDPAAFWPVAAEVTAAGEAATGEAAAGRTGLEDRDAFEVEPAPVFVGVPLWRQHGRKWLDELTDAELKEVTDAVQRGEVIAEPPPRPAGVAYPKRERWRETGNWVSPEALAAR